MEYEKLGSFYLGREIDPETKSQTDDLVLYDSRDLVTHGVVLGMTGSGKTGLCISLLEEAAMDGIPAIVIDPKGDIANLMLTFPELSADEFKPWVNPDTARRKGVSVDQFAADQAELWKSGLAQWGQTGERIRKMRDQVETTIFTPGSTAGIPVSILGSLAAPDAALIDDREAFADLIESAVTGILTMAGVDADPVQSREHILLASILQHYWTQGENLDLPRFIQAIQSPPIQRIGALDLDQFFPEDKRFDLGIRINNLIASPGFSQWLNGFPLDIDRLLYSPEGKPRISIISIAHLSDSERMFVVSMVLNRMVEWMRRQSGTTSLRALVYMDEIFGFLPPTANPPSKKPLMTLLKQARAYGVGTLLATQNPVDLDYKALSNIGTWFLGRLQTERDQARVMSGLEGAASSQGGQFDRKEIEQMLASLNGREFLLHNVHAGSDRVFHTRWAMSYLAGPLSRPQIETLTDPIRDRFRFAHQAPQHSNAPGKTKSSAVKPRTNAKIDEYFLPPLVDGADDLSFHPYLLRQATVRFIDPSSSEPVERSFSELIPLVKSIAVTDEDHLEPFDANDRLTSVPTEGIPFEPLPTVASESPFFTSGARKWKDTLYRNERLDVPHCPALDLEATIGESPAQFQMRIAQKARELRDETKDDLRRKYSRKLETLEDRLRRAEQAVEREAEQAAEAKRSTLIEVGMSVLGALFGGRRITTSRLGTAGRKVSRSYQQHTDIARAEENLEDAQQDLEAMERELEDELAAIDDRLSPANLAIETQQVKPLKKNIDVTSYALVWRAE
ncbi:ATP-binding protein [Sulfuriroseicoccus oceanibius]|uniref:ATP-binding protein n=1 Tax=Sulfuriroseicoccus oceanibius TaxID=2707525 RepID=A0A6B3LEK7_9BACT|nr:DUF87 domain-containing protein [Sulfuriroseicoccus oceanibius]QQL44965.1 ATP-binding protein [Sulfuriroseicoccus oceanibius]